ncbi:MAG TPA: hypothetical protein VIL85_20975 [Thermomicrobiales bacterium]|jgi:hypothetical protein
MSKLLAPCRLDDLDGWVAHEATAIEGEPIRAAALQVCLNLDAFVRWSARAELLWAGCDRVPKYHNYPQELKSLARGRGVTLDSRSNGPAVSAFLIAGGERPQRTGSTHAWSVHHIYDNQFPYPGKTATLHARADGLHFTQSAGLVAIHPIADAVCAEFAFAAWLLRAHAYLRFGYDPDEVFGGDGGKVLGFGVERVPKLHYIDESFIDAARA